MDFSRCLFLDFEARSEVSIKDVGAWAYAQHPTTEPLCCAWAVGMDAPVQLWLPGDPIPAMWDDGGLTWVAHNHEVEQLILRYKLGLEKGPWIDTAVAAAAAGLPRALGDAAKSLRLSTQKGDKSVMLQLSRPRKPSKENKDKFWTPATRPDLFEKLYAYCKDDVEATRGLLRALPRLKWVLPPREVRLGELTDKMNARGVLADVAGVSIAQREIDHHCDALRKEWAELVPGILPRSKKKVAAFLGLDNCCKDTIREALRTEPEGPRHRALTILKTLSLASTAKLEAVQQRATSDGRLHGLMVFHGAGRTGRWSSYGFQVQNLIQGLEAGTVDWPATDESPGATDRLFAALHADVLPLLYSNPTRALAAGMKGFLVGPFTMGDFVRIEPLVLAAWAGQTDAVADFKSKIDIYKKLATRIYGVPLEAVTKDQRFMGKRGVLGCGYQIGGRGFKANLKKDFDIDIELEEAQRVVDSYRNSNKRVVALWYAIERMAKQCILEQWQTLKTSVEVPRIAMRMVDKWMVIRLPTVRCLWYFEPELEQSDFGLQIVYWGRNAYKGGAWGRIKTYGGKLVENVTQAIAREVMADAMLRLDDAGFPPLMTVHDEIVNEGEVPSFKEIMSTPPTWWPDLPLDVDVKVVRRYQK